MSQINRFGWHVKHEASGMMGMDLGVDEEWLNFQPEEIGAVILKDHTEEEKVDGDS